MRKSYFITALAVCLALVTAQAQEAVVKRTTARKAAKMAPSERFVRVAKARGGEGTVVQKAATLPITRRTNISAALPPSAGSTVTRR